MKKQIQSFLLAAAILCFSISVTAGSYDVPTPIPDTGQTQCYDADGNVSDSCPSEGEAFYGQDAQYQGYTRSYTKLGHNGIELPDNAVRADYGGDWIMTRDNVTGLIWEVKTNTNRLDEYQWTETETEFISGLNTDNFGGFSDWRLPSVKELSFLLNSGTYSPAINQEWFPNTMLNYWSSTIYNIDTGGIWLVNFSTGAIYRTIRSDSCYVRAVRGGQIGQFDDFIDNYNGTVTDPNTGLMWQKQTEYSNYMTWEEALEYAENIELAGYTDWRMPNRNELMTLVNQCH